MARASHAASQVWVNRQERENTAVLAHPCTDTPTLTCLGCGGTRCLGCQAGQSHRYSSQCGVPSYIRTRARTRANPAKQATQETPALRGSKCRQATGRFRPDTATHKVQLCLSCVHTHSAQWVLNRVPYGSVDSVLQAVAGSPQSANAAGRAILFWQPAGSADIWQISAHVLCSSLAVCLQHPNAEKMRSSCCSSAERSFKSYSARSLAFPPIGSRFRHTAAYISDAENMLCNCNQVQGSHRSGAEDVCCNRGSVEV